jgi:NAD(P)-dependent dehydrogenase (short-subunit alcohol dehydrogenase family)
MRLQGKTALITGAGQGIGAAIAEAFVDQGATVCIADLNPETGRATAAALRRRGGVAMALVCDVADRASVDHAVSETLRTFGRIDILVNNAGVNVFRDPLRMADDDWRRCMAVDLEGAWHASRAVLPAMLARRQGAIVNIASVHAFSIISGCFPYPVAKHALLGLTRSLGIEYAAHGIRVNAIAPGYVDTPIADAYFATCGDPAVERRKAERLHPPGRMGRPEEIAMTAVFLASDEAPFINAAVIPVDGGRSTLYHE